LFALLCPYQAGSRIVQAVQEKGAYLMELRHYSKEKIEFDRDRTYRDHGARGGKPDGFWVSVAGPYDWEWWCREEDFGLHHLAVVHRVTLAEDATILRITCGKELDAFHNQWAVETRMSRSLDDAGVTDKRYWEVDWAAVAERWEGIIMAPYLRSHRFVGSTPFWYLGVDAASCCIWNPRAVASVEVISDPP